MDPIADMLSQIRNAAAAGKASVKLSYSKKKMAILERLLERGYIAGAEHKGAQPNKVIEVTFAYNDANTPKIRGARRVSKPSRRMYEKAKNIQPFKHGYGDVIVTTPAGILTDTQAKEQNVGGEVLFEIW